MTVSKSDIKSFVKENFLQYNIKVWDKNTFAIKTLVHFDLLRKSPGDCHPRDNGSGKTVWSTRDEK